jgi:hypothetical protein
LPEASIVGQDSIPAGGDSLPVSEPVTMLTDYALAGVAWMLARRLRRATDSRAAALWALAFEVTGLAAVAGGSVHGFGSLLPAWLDRALWVGTVMSVGLASALLLAGAAFAALGPGRLRGVLLALCALKLAAYLALVAFRPDFRYAVYDSLPAALFVLAFLARRFGRGRSPAAALGALGLLLSIAGAVLQQSRLGIHPFWFNHNDLYHVIQAGALWLLHKAGLELRDSASS